LARWTVLIRGSGVLRQVGAGQAGIRIAHQPGRFPLARANISERQAHAVLRQLDGTETHSRYHTVPL